MRPKMAPIEPVQSAGALPLRRDERGGMKGGRARCREKGDERVDAGREGYRKGGAGGRRRRAQSEEGYPTQTVD